MSTGTLKTTLFVLLAQSLATASTGIPSGGLEQIGILVSNLLVDASGDAGVQSCVAVIVASFNL